MNPTCSGADVIPKQRFGYEAKELETKRRRGGGGLKSESGNRFLAFAGHEIDTVSIIFLDSPPAFWVWGLVV
ncbi:hypothetical protein MUK42_18306 [Musa troglodytarum]|uniref:Uncharacterized protein n=1 Tax=Musa troglodytarum TaxID=320322 RepID=A0A9E7FII9_9LILI|nr:hypothetical protein MUK42_18306 [Musa troglodytarum]